MSNIKTKMDKHNIRLVECNRCANCKWFVCDYCGFEECNHPDNGKVEEGKGPHYPLRDGICDAWEKATEEALEESDV